MQILLIAACIPVGSKEYAICNMEPPPLVRSFEQKAAACNFFVDARQVKTR